MQLENFVQLNAKSLTRVELGLSVQKIVKEMEEKSGSAREGRLLQGLGRERRTTTSWGRKRRSWRIFFMRWNLDPIVVGARGSS